MFVSSCNSKAKDVISLPNRRRCRFDECCFEAGFVDEGAPLCEDVKNVTDICLDQGRFAIKQVHHPGVSKLLKQPEEENTSFGLKH